MIAGKLQSRERHVFDVFLLSCVVFPGMDHLKIVFREKNEIFWVDITILPFLRAFACLIELRLQISTGVVRSIVVIDSSLYSLPLNVVTA